MYQEHCFQVGVAPLSFNSALFSDLKHHRGAMPVLPLGSTSSDCVGCFRRRSCGLCMGAAEAARCAGAARMVISIRNRGSQCVWGQAESLQSLRPHPTFAHSESLRLGSAVDALASPPVDSDECSDLGTIGPHHVSHLQCC